MMLCSDTHFSRSSTQCVGALHLCTHKNHTKAHAQTHERRWDDQITCSASDKCDLFTTPHLTDEMTKEKQLNWFKNLAKSLVTLAHALTHTNSLEIYSKFILAELHTIFFSVNNKCLLGQRDWHRVHIALWWFWEYLRSLLKNRSITKRSSSGQQLLRCCPTFN